jgi:hypothetical protein
MGINYGTVIQLWAEKNGAHIEHASEYGEPGYTGPRTGIVFMNWNDVPKRIQDGLESQGWELEWSDEWHIDHNNGAKAYRTSPDCYSWEPRIMYAESAGDYLTPDDGLEAWITECENEWTKALPSWWDEADIAALGWTKTSDTYESGFHPGQNDKPNEISAALKKAGKQFVFQIGGKGQFDIHFHVWVKDDE